MDDRQSTTTGSRPTTMIAADDVVVLQLADLGLPDLPEPP